MRRPNIELHVEEIVLVGLEELDRGRFAAAVEAELARLLAGTGLPAALAEGADLPRLDAGALTAGPGVTPDALGSALARTIYGGMGGQ